MGNLHRVEHATFAKLALSNLASVAINTSLISDTDSTDDLGSTGVRWSNIYVDVINLTNGSNNFILSDNSGAALAIEDASSNRFYIIDTREDIAGL